MMIFKFELQLTYKADYERWFNMFINSFNNVSSDFVNAVINRVVKAVRSTGLAAKAKDFSINDSGWIIARSQNTTGLQFQVIIRSITGDQPRINYKVYTVRDFDGVEERSFSLAL